MDTPNRPKSEIVEPAGWRIQNVRTGGETIERLLELGFSQPKVLRESIQDGAGAYRAAATPHHPAPYPGERMWGETCASLAAYTHGHGWDKESFDGVDLILNRVTGVAVIVTAGDSATGIESAVPNVRYKRAKVISGLVNGSYDTLFDIGERPEWQVWFLLHNVTQARVVPAELSQPRGIGASGRVLGWNERLIVPDSSEDGEPTKITDSNSPVAGGDAPLDPIVSVRRRIAE